MQKLTIFEFALKTVLRVFKTENVVPLVTHTNAETHYIWICILFLLGIEVLTFAHFLTARNDAFLC